MDNKISNASIKFNCTQDWDIMEPVTEGRFCDVCQKKVYDLTDKNVAFFTRIMMENNNKICGRFSSDQLAKPAHQSNRPYWKKWLIAALVLIGFNAAAQKVKAQGIAMGKVLPRPTEADCGTQALLGEVLIMPNPVQLRSLHAYMVKKCKVPTSVNGRLMASFTVGKDGNLKDLAISNHLGENVREEVLSILKNAPKWKKADESYGRPYALSLTFKNGKVAPGD